jgi:hypothetical protein
MYPDTRQEGVEPGLRLVRRHTVYVGPEKKRKKEKKRRSISGARGRHRLAGNIGEGLRLRV